MQTNHTPGTVPGQLNPLAVAPQDSPGLSLGGLRDLLEALAPQIRELPSPLPLFATELEEGLAEQLGFEAQNEKTTGGKLVGTDAGGCTAGPTPYEGVDPCS